VPFRVAIGPCRCREPYGALQAKACNALDEQLAIWRGRLPSDLRAVPAEAHSQEWVDGYRITFSTYKQTSPSGDTLIVSADEVRVGDRCRGFRS
jgi:hypothetical protein